MNAFFRNSFSSTNVSAQNLEFFKHSAEDSLKNYGKSLDTLLKSESRIPILSEFAKTLAKLNLAHSTAELVDGLER